MQDEPQTPAPPRRKRRFARICLLLVIAVCLFFGWRQYTFYNALREAKAFGFVYGAEDPYTAIQKDRRAAFRVATWTAKWPSLWVWGDKRLASAHERNLFRRLRPSILIISNCDELEKLNFLKEVPSFQGLVLQSCPRLKNLDALEKNTTLQWLDIYECAGIRNLDIPSGLTSLKSFRIWRCQNLQNVNGLARFTQLEEFFAMGCRELESVDGLPGLARLQSLSLYQCAKVKSIDALKSLKGLRAICLSGCYALSSDEVAAVRGNLPEPVISDRHLITPTPAN